MFPGLDLSYADPAQPFTRAGEELDDLYDLDHVLSVGGVKRLLVCFDCHIYLYLYLYLRV